MSIIWFRKNFALLLSHFSSIQFEVFNSRLRFHKGPIIKRNPSLIVLDLYFTTSNYFRVNVSICECFFMYIFNSFCIIFVIEEILVKTRKKLTLEFIVYLYSNSIQFKLKSSNQSFLKHIRVLRSNSFRRLKLVQKWFCRIFRLKPEIV